MPPAALGTEAIGIIDARFRRLWQILSRLVGRFYATGARMAPGEVRGNDCNKGICFEGSIIFLAAVSVFRTPEARRGGRMPFPS